MPPLIFSVQKFVCWCCSYVYSFTDLSFEGIPPKDSSYFHAKGNLSAFVGRHEQMACPSVNDRLNSCRTDWPWEPVGPDVRLKFWKKLYFKKNKNKQTKKKQARRTAMDRSNKGNLLNVAKHSRRLKLAISRSKNQNSHLQNIISIDIHQRVPHSQNQVQREITFSNMPIFVAI